MLRDNNNRTLKIKDELLDRVMDSLLVYATTNGGDILDLEEKDIWRMAGISKATYYRNFTGLNSIFREIQREVYEQISSNLTAYISAETKEQRKFLLYKFFVMLELNRKACVIALYRDDMSFWHAIVAIMEPFIRRSWRNSSDLSYRFFYEAFLGAIVFVVRAWMERDFDHDLIWDCSTQAGHYLDLFGSLQNTDMKYYLKSRPLYADDSNDASNPNAQ